MADDGYDYDKPMTETPRRRPGMDVFTLIIGLATLLVSAYTLTDGASWMPTFDLRWILAGGAVLVGVMMLAASFRSPRPH